MKTTEDKQIKKVLILAGLIASSFGVGYGMLYKGMNLREAWGDLWGFYGNVLLSFVLLGLTVGAGIFLKAIYQEYKNRR